MGLKDAVLSALKALFNWFVKPLAEGLTPAIETLVELTIYTPVPTRTVNGSTTPAIFNQPSNGIFPAVYTAYYDAVVSVLFLGLILTILYTFLEMGGLIKSSNGMNSKASWFRLLIAVILGYPLLMVGLHGFNILSHLFTSGDVVTNISEMVAGALGVGALTSIAGGAPFTGVMGLISTTFLTLGLLFLAFHALYMPFFVMFAPFFALFYFSELPILKPLSKMGFTLWIVLGMSKPIMGGIFFVMSEAYKAGLSTLVAGGAVSGLMMLAFAFLIPAIPFIVPSALILGTMSLASGGGVHGSLIASKVGGKTPPGRPTPAQSGGGGGSGGNLSGLTSSGGGSGGAPENSVLNTRAGEFMANRGGQVSQKANRGISRGGRIASLNTKAGGKWMGRKAARKAKRVPGKAKGAAGSLLSSSGSTSGRFGHDTNLPEFRTPELQLPDEVQDSISDKRTSYSETLSAKYDAAQDRIEAGRERALSAKEDVKWGLEQRYKVDEHIQTITDQGIDSDEGQKALDEISNVVEQAPEGGSTKFKPDTDEMTARISTGNKTSQYSEAIGHATKDEVISESQTEVDMVKVMDEMEERSENISYNNETRRRFQNDKHQRTT